MPVLRQAWVSMIAAHKQCPMAASLPGCSVTTVMPRSRRSIDIDLVAAFRAALLQSKTGVSQRACMSPLWPQGKAVGSTCSDKHSFLLRCCRPYTPSAAGPQLSCQVAMLVLHMRQGLKVNSILWWS